VKVARGLMPHEYLSSNKTRSSVAKGKYICHLSAALSLDRPKIGARVEECEEAGTY
jgi:hypothetical protein